MWMIPTGSFMFAVASWVTYAVGHERHPKLDPLVWVGWALMFVAVISGIIITS